VSGESTDVLGEEAVFVRRRREASGLDASRPARIGLALSGGGIRSATFSLGVLQALSRQRLVPHLDYLSTVSGGSYIGSFFGALYVDPARRGAATGLDDATRREFIDRPLQSPRGRDAVARLREFGRYLTPGGSSDALFGASLVARNWVSLQLVLGLVPFLLFLLLRCLGGSERWAIGRITLGQVALALGQLGLSVTLATLLGLCVVLGASRAVAYWFSRREQVSPSIAKRLLTNGPLVAAAVAACWLWLAYLPGIHGAFVRCDAAITGREVAAAGAPVPVECADWPRLLFAQGVPLLLAAVLTLAVLAYGRQLIRAMRELPRGAKGASPAETEERIRSRLTRALATANSGAVATGALLVVDALGFRLHLATEGMERNLGFVLNRFGSAEVYAGLAVGWRYFWPFAAVLAPAVLTIWAHRSLRRGSGPGWLARPSGQGALGLAIMFLWLVIWSALSWSVAPPALFPVAALVTLAVAIACLCYGFLNLSSLVTLYAARLKRAYVGASNPDDRSAGFDVERIGDRIDMPDYYALDGADPLAEARPLHIINVTIAQTEPDGHSQIVAYDRKGKPMQVTPAGLVYQHGGPGAFRRRPMTDGEALPLSTWTAISGAAASTAVGGLSSLGLSILTMMANVRLGYWWRADASGSSKPLSLADTVLGYLYGELQSRFDTDPGKRRWYLTDGGHFENTGAYSLIQRRLDFIIVCDNAADPDYRLDDVVRLIDRARTDLNTDVTFLGGRDLDRLFGADGPLRRAFGTYREVACPPREDGGLPAPYAALARLTYGLDREDVPDHEDGAIDPAAPGPLLLLIKPRLTFAEPPELLAYRRREAGSAFPQQSTLDQYFDEEQWEAYRRFGEVVGHRLFASPATGWCPARHVRGEAMPVTGEARR